MKKAISVILSLLFAFSVFSIGASAVEAEPTRFDKWMSNHESDNELAVRINVRAGGYLIGFMKFNAYFKGENFAMIMDLDGREIKAVQKGDDLLIFLTKFPFMHYKMKAEEIFGSENEGFSECSFNKEYELEIEGKKFLVEEYILESDGQEYQLSAYFEGDELKKIIISHNVADMDMEVEFEILSYEVDDDMFKMPLISLDVTFLVDLLLKIGLV